MHRAFFYAIGTAAGRIAGPLVFGWLIGQTTPEDTSALSIGYYIGAVLMIAGGIIIRLTEGPGHRDRTSDMTAVPGSPRAGCGRPTGHPSCAACATPSSTWWPAGAA